MNSTWFSFEERLFRLFKTAWDRLSSVKWYFAWQPDARWKKKKEKKKSLVSCKSLLLVGSDDIVRRRRVESEWWDVMKGWILYSFFPSCRLFAVRERFVPRHAASTTPLAHLHADGESEYGRLGKNCRYIAMAWARWCGRVRCRRTRRRLRHQEA